MAIIPLFPDQVVDELSAVAAAAYVGALLISPAGTIEFVRGDVTPEGAHLARTNASRATVTLNDPTSIFLCDDGSRVRLLAISDGWVVAVQTRAELSIGMRLAARRALDKLSLWLAYAQFPPPGRDSGQSGAPAEAFAERPRKRRS